MISFANSTLKGVWVVSLEVIIKFRLVFCQIALFHFLELYSISLENFKLGWEGLYPSKLLQSYFLLFVVFPTL